VNWVADEHISRSIVERLRRDGHSVVFAAEQAPGADDDVLLADAARTGALVLTADKDFGELIFRQGKARPLLESCSCVWLVSPQRRRRASWQRRSPGTGTR
jgi:predicted nuclease of predicted toxin-antitoxin system